MANNETQYVFARGEEPYLYVQRADYQRGQAAIELLRRMEWYTTPGDDEGHCIDCGSYQHKGHREGCELAAIVYPKEAADGE